MRPILFGEAYRVKFQPMQKTSKEELSSFWAEKQGYVEKQFLKAAVNAGIRGQFLNHDGYDYFIYNGPRANTVTQLREANQKFDPGDTKDLQALGLAYIRYRDYVREQGILEPDGTLTLNYRVSDMTGGVHLENAEQAASTLKK